jgi:hypothetical protein
MKVLSVYASRAAGFCRMAVKSVALPLVGSAWLVATAQAAGPTLPNAILFVTQVPIPNEVNADVADVFVSVASALGNHLSDTAHAGRGGDLWMRYPNGALTNLTRAAGYGVNGVQHTNGIAVRQPCMHWSGTKAIFSMIVGAPRFSGDTNQFFWQLYEVTNLFSATPVIAKVANQPTNYNNVSPCYGTDERIIFTCDRPRDGSAHLYPQLDEYNDVPTVTGLWSLAPATGDLFMMNHTPSGAFTPLVDSFGRVVFTRWDHLVQDRNATDDRLGRATNGTFNYTDESANSPWNPLDRAEIFPEPRTYDTTNNAAQHVNGIAFNSFFPWTIFEDGSGEEILNHVGRHELMNRIVHSFTDDTNLFTFTSYSTRLPNTNYLDNFFQIREGVTNPGVYYGIDAVDFGTHASGQIITLTGPPNLNPSQMFITYITGKGNPNGSFRNPLPMSDGTLVAGWSKTTLLDTNIGTVTAPKSRYDFRLMTLQKSGATWTTNQFLTPGLTNPVSYWNGTTLITNNNQLWELDPVEVRASTKPQRLTNSIQSIEQQVFDEEGVAVPVLQKYLQANNLALIVSHNVTARDKADIQQPYNLRIAGTTNQTIANSGKLYDIAHIQFLQADQRRGATLTGTNPIPGRRVLATLLHDPAVDNVANPAGPLGSVKLGDDGSFAAFVPARRAMTWQLTDPNGGSVVKERYWVTFQPGEIRTCKNCHGINTVDQAGNPPPNNKPQALRDLLQYWKTENIPALTNYLQSSTNYLAITFKRRPAVTNVTHTVEVSGDLVNWLPGSSYSATATNANTARTSEISRSGTNPVTIIVRDNFPIKSGTNLFMRLKVSAP